MFEYRKRMYDNFVSKHWTYTHSLSDKEYELLHRTSRKRFAGILPQDKNAKIADLACGSGHFLYFLDKEGYKNISGIDISPEQIKAAETKGIKNIKVGDIFGFLPEHKAEFDVIIANDIIEHFLKDEILHFLDLIYGALKPGGIAIISTMNSSSLFGSNVTFIDFTHETGLTPESLKQVMRVCNFEPVVYGEKPVIYGFKSAARACLWWIMDKVLRMLYIIERGTGSGVWKTDYIFEPRMFAVGRKKS